MEWEKGHGCSSGTPVWREVFCAVSWQQRKAPLPLWTHALQHPIPPLEQEQSSQSAVLQLESNLCPSPFKSRQPENRVCNVIACTKQLRSLLAFYFNILIWQTRRDAETAGLLLNSCMEKATLRPPVSCGSWQHWLSWSSSSLSTGIGAPSRKETRHRPGQN